MPIQRTTAKRLVSDSEFKLINESFPPLIGSLSDKALVQRMDRARKARDRYHTMVERQRTKAQTSRRSTTPRVNMKDVMSKEKLFDETLARFERRTSRSAGSAGVQAATPRRTMPKSSATVTASGKATARKASKQTPAGKAKATAAAKSTPLKTDVKRPARAALGKSSGERGGAQGTSKASAKTGSKSATSKSTVTRSAPKGDGKTAASKSGKGKGAATKRTPRGRHGAMVANTTLH